MVRINSYQLTRRCTRGVYRWQLHILIHGHLRSERHWEVNRKYDKKLTDARSLFLKRFKKLTRNPNYLLTSTSSYHLIDLLYQASRVWTPCHLSCVRRQSQLVSTSSRDGITGCYHHQVMEVEALELLIDFHYSDRSPSSAVILECGTYLGSCCYLESFEWSDWLAWTSNPFGRQVGTGEDQAVSSTFRSFQPLPPSPCPSSLHPIHIPIYWILLISWYQS